jgi:hypothetical protein
MKNYGRKNTVKKDAILYLIFLRNLDQIVAKIMAVMLVKKCKNQTFFTALNFFRMLAFITGFLHRRM